MADGGSQLLCMLRARAGRVLAADLAPVLVRRPIEHRPEGQAPHPGPERARRQQAAGPRAPALHLSEEAAAPGLCSGPGRAESQIAARTVPSDSVRTWDVGSAATRPGTTAISRGVRGVSRGGAAVGELFLSSVVFLLLRLCARTAFITSEATAAKFRQGALRHDSAIPLSSTFSST